MALKAVTTKLPSLQLPEKLKGTIVERWANYWKGLARDYKGKQANKYFFTQFSVFIFLDVAIDSVKTIREKPVKAGVYGSIGAFIYGCCKTAPDYHYFDDQMKKAENAVALVPLESQNPKTVNYLKMINRQRNNETLRITSFGLFSLMWTADFADGLATYDATCDYLKPELKNFNERIVDIGWWNNWWNLEKMMKDYDVNF